MLEKLLDYYNLASYHPEIQGWIGAAIIGASALISGLLANRKSKKERDYSKQESELAYQREVEMIDKQNEYNDPKNQMSRLEGAGLNPALVYGSGTASAGNQSSHASYEPPREQSFHALAIPEILSGYQDFQMKQAQVDNVKANTANVQEKTINEAERNFLLKLQGKTGEFDLDRRKYLAPYQAAIAGNEARSSEAKLLQEWQRVTNLQQQGQMNLLEQDYKRKAMTAVDLDNEKRQADILFKKYQNQWAKAGITSSDNIIMRILVRMMSDSGFNADIEKLLPK